jgi:cytochrome c5
VARGRDALLASVQAGLNGMPARGLCPDCSDEELRRLIDFLVEGR